MIHTQNKEVLLRFRSGNGRTVYVLAGGEPLFQDGDRADGGVDQYCQWTTFNASGLGIDCNTTI